MEEPGSHITEYIKLINTEDTLSSVLIKARSINGPDHRVTTFLRGAKLWWPEFKRGIEMSSHIHNTSCQCVARSAPFSQNLDEMDFARGIWSAAMNGEIDQVQKYLDKKGSPDALDSAGYTALHYAARHGHTDVCKILLKSGANPNSLTRAGKASPLHRAAHSGHSDILKLLIEYGAKLDSTDIDGQTALHKAAQNSHKEVIQLLVKHEPRLTLMKDKRDRLPEDYVSESIKQQQYC